MRSSRFSSASKLRLAALLGTIALASGAAAEPASAATVQIPGNPLTIWVGDTGSFQELVAGNTDYSFFPRSNVNGSAGFVLALPSSGQSGVYTAATLAGKVWGWASGDPNPTFSGGAFTPLSQGAVGGSGTDGDPYTQLTKYRLVVGIPLIEVEQTTSYVNGSSTFVIQYRVKNLVSDAIKFRALIGADLFLNGSDCGTGVFKPGPPRFVGGTSLGRVGGFTEEPSSPWAHYFEGQASTSPQLGCQSIDSQSPNTVWEYLQGAADGSGFPDTVNTSDTVDNGIGVQWDTYYTTALGGNATSAAFQLNTLGTVPGLLKLTPSSQSISAGTQAGLTAAVTDGSGGPASGSSVRFAVSGANSSSGTVTTDGSGQAAISYTPTKGGTDTVTAFQDIDANGAQGQAEPSGTATVNVAAAPGAQSDKTPPRLRIIVRRSVKRKVLLKRLVTAANINESSSLRFELLGPAKARAKTYPRKLARKSLPFGKGGTRAVALKAKKKKLIKAKKFKVRVRVTATDRAGNRTVATKLVRVK